MSQDFYPLPNFFLLAKTIPIWRLVHRLMYFQIWLRFRFVNDDTAASSIDTEVKKCKHKFCKYFLVKFMLLMFHQCNFYYLIFKLNSTRLRNPGFILALCRLQSFLRRFIFDSTVKHNLRNSYKAILITRKLRVIIDAAEFDSALSMIPRSFLDF